MTKTMSRILTESQRAYEQKRAAKAGMSLEKWMAAKERKQTVDMAPPKAAPPKKPNLFSRLIERAQKPLGPK